jgi:TPR repeat protein
VKKLLLIAAITFSLGSMTANAATTFEVEEFNRASELSSSAIQSKNYDEAFEHLETASKLGNKVSQFTLALLYMEGLGVKQDYAQAYLWLNVASEVNENKWQKVRDQLHNALSKEQVAALTPLVDEYIEKYGAKAQEVSCYKRAAIGTNRKQMLCTKHRTPGR